MHPIIKSIADTATANRMAPAIIGPQTYLTYGDLIDKIARISNHFADRRIPPGSKIFINVSDQNLRLIITLACMHYGLIPFAIIELGNIAETVDHDFVVGSPTPRFPEIASDLTIDRTVLEGKLSDGTLREFANTAPEDIMFVSTTTGTTGRKKLVAETLSSYTLRGSDRVDAFEPGDRVLFTIGDVAKYGTTLSFRILQQGAAIVRKAGGHMPETMKLISKYSVNKLVTTPAALDRMLRALEQLGMQCPSVKQISITGSLFYKELLEKLESAFSQAQIRVGYGSSEAGGVSAGFVKAATFRTGYVGEVLPSVKLVSAGTAENPSPITIVNDQRRLTNYYSKGKIVPNTEAFYGLPDLGYVEGTSLYLLGRDDEVFNISGNKYPFSVLEAEIRTIPGVRDAAMTSAMPIGDVIGVVIGVASDVTIDLEQVIEKIVRKTGQPIVRPHLYPFQTVDIVRDEMGKVSRKALIDGFQTWLAGQKQRA